MQSIQRTLLGSFCALPLLAACNFEATSTGSTAGLSTSGSAPSVASGGTGTGPVGIVTTATAPPTFQPVTATASVAGTVSVIPGANQSITVAFTSANGLPVQGLALSNTTFPAGWSGPSDFTCSATGSGSSCVLTLTYEPKAVDAGTLKVSYVYVGDKTPPPGTFISIPYAATTSNNIVAMAAPIGQVNAPVGTGSQAVTVNFTTDDGNLATGLAIVSGLTSLPAGWSTSTPGFSCAVISNGSGCQLVLNYAPKAAGSGLLTLGFAYTDDTGLARSGAINLPYSTTANGNVVATASPAGQINAVQMTGRQPVKVTFTTDDGKAAQDLMLLTSLSSLPAGWSSTTSGFTCATVNTGNGCQLGLTFAPTSLTSGTVTLYYGYTSPAGVFTTGSMNIPYAATTNNNVVATATPSGEIDAIVGEVTPGIHVSFTTDDLRTATQLQLTTDLAALPAGWSSSDSTFACAGVSGAATCRLPLTYAPTEADAGTMALRYAYQNNAGQAKSGSLNLPYRATTDDTVTGTSSPSSLAVLAGSSTAVTVSFATDDGNPAGTLSVTSDLTMLPVGWSSADSVVTCATVSAAASCQLALTYQPTTADSGTLTLGFSYTNNAGLLKTGTVLVPYSATP